LLVECLVLVESTSPREASLLVDRRRGLLDELPKFRFGICEHAEFQRRRQGALEMREVPPPDYLSDAVGTEDGTNLVKPIGDLVDRDFKKR
jgi:hypothetical protein